MYLLRLLFFIGLGYVVYSDTKGQSGPAPKGDECVRRITTQVARYFWKLQSRRIDYRERNNRIFADIPFPQLTTVYGWTMRGKTGRISQVREDGRGIITEYMVQFLSSDGNWTFINNSKTGKEMFTNLGNIAIPDTTTSITLSNPVKTLVLRVIPELWDGVPFMMLSIQHCADTVMAEQRPILPLQIQHSSVKKNLEDQIKQRIQSKIAKVVKKVKQMKQRIDHHKGHGANGREKAGKHKSSEDRNRVNHRKNKSRRKLPPPPSTEQKKTIIKTQHQPRSKVRRKSLDGHASDIYGRFERGDYLGEFGYKYRREHQGAPKRKNSKEKGMHQRKKNKKYGKKKQSKARKHKLAQQKSRHKDSKTKKKQPKAKMAHIKSKAKKKLQPNANKHKTLQQKNKQKGGQNSQQIKKIKSRKHSKSSGKKSDEPFQDNKRKIQSTKGQRSRQQTVGLLTKKIKKTEKTLNNLKKELYSFNQKTPHSKNEAGGNKPPKSKTKSRGQESRKGGTHASGRKPATGKPREKSQKTSNGKSSTSARKPQNGRPRIQSQQSSNDKTPARARKPQIGKPQDQNQQSFKGQTPARKPYTPDTTPPKNVKTATESIAPAKPNSSGKLVEMQRLEKENTDLSQSVYGSCRLRPVWRYNKAIFRPEDTFSALRDVKQAWRAMYGLGIQPYRFIIPERFQKFRNQKYYLEIDFPKITNVFGLKVAGSSSQLQWGAVTRFSLYHKRKDSEPWQGYVDRLNQPRVFDVGTREKGNAHAPSVFRLDVPITAKAIRIYPEKWASTPILMVDLITCETSFKH